MSEAYSKPCQTFKTECFVKIVNGLKQWTIFAKRSILDVWQGVEYVSRYEIYPPFLDLSYPNFVD